MSCPLYGHHAVPGMQLLVSIAGNNQCPLRPGYAPCAMETNSQAPDLEACAVAASCAGILDELRQRFSVAQLDAGTVRTFAEHEARP